MAQFIFKLQTLLKQRLREEQEAQRFLATHAAVVNQLQESLRTLNAEMQTNTETVRQHLLGKLDMQFLGAHRRFTGSMQRKGMELMQQIANAQKKADAARRALAEAAKARKAIEKLREKQFDRWRTEQARKEAAAADEIAAQIGYENSIDSIVSIAVDAADPEIAGVAALVSADNSGERP